MALKKYFFKFNRMNALRVFVKILSYFFNTNILHFAIFFVGLFKYRKSYSEFGEDLVVYEYFKYKKIINGKYLDIGCFHPNWISNTALFHKLGWSGYAVDLDSVKLNYFKIFRGNKVRTITAAISNNRSKFVNYYSFNKHHPYSPVNTLSKYHANQIKKKWKINFKLEKIKNYHVNDLFTLVGKINFLTIDIEGIDGLIIKKADFSLVDPDVILFEDPFNYFATDKVKSFFNNINKKNGEYKILFQSGYSKCFAKI